MVGGREMWKDLPSISSPSSTELEQEACIATMRNAPLSNYPNAPELPSPLAFVEDLSLWVDEIRTVLWAFRTGVLVPLLKLMVVLCMVMSVMVVTEMIFMGAVSLYVKLVRRNPKRIYKWEPLTGDEEMGSLAYPMVLVQVPMYNEKEVYKLSIGAVCDLLWPSDRIVIQVLDDSTDPVVKDLVKKECQKWAEKGMNIKHVTRSNRRGYKEGALEEGMKQPHVQSCDYVTIFDADFQPESDFLLRTVPFLMHNPEIALVKACWRFVNANECIMTRMQEMSLNYHFKVEQESGSSTQSFKFNGTAGVWKIKALEEAGGWNHRSTVEDMDLAVRVSLCGWKFLYVGDVKACYFSSSFPSAAFNCCW